MSAATWRLFLSIVMPELSPLGFLPSRLLHEPNYHRQQLARAQSYAECEYLVSPTGNDCSLPSHEFPIGDFGNLRGAHHSAAEKLGRIHSGTPLKARPRRPRTQYAHVDPGALQFVRQGLRKREDVGLAGVIHGHKRTGLKSRG